MKGNKAAAQRLKKAAVSHLELPPYLRMTYPEPSVRCFSRHNGLPSVNHQGAPKRAPSAFLIWCKDRRRQLKAENPKMANIDISKMLGDEWRYD